MTKNGLRFSLQTTTSKHAVLVYTYKNADKNGLKYMPSKPEWQKNDCYAAKISPRSRGQNEWFFRIINSNVLTEYIETMSLTKHTSLGLIKRT